MTQSLALVDYSLLKAADVLATFPASNNMPSSKCREQPYLSCTFTCKADAVEIKKPSRHRVEISGESCFSTTRAAIFSKHRDWQRVLASYLTQPLIEGHNVAVENPDQPTVEPKIAQYLTQLLRSSL